MEIYIEQLKTFSLDFNVAINRLLKQLDHKAPILRRADIKDMIFSPTNRLFVASKSDSKEIVGMLTLIVFRIPFAKKGLLEDLVVDKQHRNKGAGTKLILAALNQARKEKVAYLDFTSVPTRLAANKLYQRLGFKKRNTNVYRIVL